MTYIVTMVTGRQYRITDYDSTKYGSTWLKFYEDGSNVSDRFAVSNIEHVDVLDRSNAELIGRVNSNAN